MRISVFGAAGNMGSRIVAEALSRGHEVSAILRDPARNHELPAAATIRVGNAADVVSVAELSIGQDIVISATRPAPGRESEHAMTARALLAGVAQAGVRLLLVGGAGSLIVPGSEGRLVADDPSFVPPTWRDIARACVAQFEICRADTQAEWTYLSPPALLAPGERTGRFRLGSNELLVDGEGNSAISMEDLAVALIDEAERPRHRRARFTAAY